MVSAAACEIMFGFRSLALTAVKIASTFRFSTTKQAALEANPHDNDSSSIFLAVLV